MTPKKNTVHSVTVDEINDLGYGVCRVDGAVCFIKDGVTGDRGDVRIIKSASSYCVGKWESLIAPSGLRRDPICAAYPACGGCAFGRIDYAEEAKIKTDHVRRTFDRAGLSDVKIVSLDPAGYRAGYRNKALIPMARDRSGRIYPGFYAESSHRAVPFDVCALTPPEFSRIAHDFARFMEERGILPYDETDGSGTVRHLYLRRVSSGEMMICAVLKTEEGFDRDGFRDFAASRCADSVYINLQPDPNNVILGERCLLVAGKPRLTDSLCGLTFEISPLSFYQVNHDCAEAIYKKAAELAELKKTDVLADLYCGAGTIGLTMARSVKSVIGVETVPQAVENARKNAALNGISNARFICADAAEALASLSPTVAVIDPPRKGTTPAFIDLIAKSTADRVVYVSCNPATLARDISFFCQNGFVPGAAYLYDMFPRTSHVETVVLMSRGG